ncbi:hypothetical protein [Streptomyces sp. MMBL 11-3]|uniref:hypothetical protein n=1 Tax=Streptomyces sp. MMBL 11-3 TaxID=3382639 RepID=UPI0039B541D6
MSEYGTRTTPGEHDEPVPRDLPDQQVQEGEDPWDVIAPPDFEQDGGSGRTGGSGDGERGAEPDGETDTGTDAQARPDGDGADAGVPDTDEAGTGRQGDQGTSTVHPEDPEPQESPG